MKTGNKAKTSRTSDGSAAVEFALVLPLLLLVILGALDWGYYFFVAQIVNNAAREGARIGAVVEGDGNVVSEAESAVTDYLTDMGLDAGTANTDVTFAGGSVSVQITYPVGSLTQFSTAIVPANVITAAEMRRE